MLLAMSCSWIQVICHGHYVRADRHLVVFLSPNQVVCVQNLLHRR